LPTLEELTTLELFDQLTLRTFNLTTPNPSLFKEGSILLRTFNLTTLLV